MERVQIEADIREGMTKGELKSLRNGGRVPAVVYGQKKEPLHITVDSKDITAILQSSAGFNTLVEIKYDGTEDTVILKDLQQEILFKERFVHADFFRISLKDKLEVDVPVVLMGEAIGVKNGGILQQPLRVVSLRCLPADIPGQIELDISGIGIGEGLSVADLTFPESAELLEDTSTVIVTVMAPRVEEAEGAEKDEEESEAEQVEEKEETE